MPRGFPHSPRLHRPEAGKRGGKKRKRGLLAAKAGITTHLPLGQDLVLGDLFAVVRLEEQHLLEADLSEEDEETVMPPERPLGGSLQSFCLLLPPGALSRQRRAGFQQVVRSFLRFVAPAAHLGLDFRSPLCQMAP